MNEANLYQYVKGKICDHIFEGIYEDGQKIPSERILADQLQVSRVTIRKSLELLEQDRLVVREVGVGTKLSLHNYGRESNMDMIVLIAPARNPFFSDFIAHVQAYVQKQEGMVLYVEKPKKETLENCLYRLYKKGLQNVVIWLEDLPVNHEKLRRLRALGMNMVFFDSNKGIPYADGITLDNEHAVKTLCQVLQKKGCQTIGYIGWDKTDIYSTLDRECAFKKQKTTNTVIIRLPWKDQDQSRKILKAFFEQQKQALPEGWICADQESGRLCLEMRKKLELPKMIICSIDDFKEAQEQGITTYAQNLERSAKTVCACLEVQNKLQSNWKAKLHLIEGILIDRKSKK